MGQKFRMPPRFCYPGEVGEALMSGKIDGFDLTILTIVSTFQNFNPNGAHPTNQYLGDQIGIGPIPASRRVSKLAEKKFLIVTVDAEGQRWLRLGWVWGRGGLILGIKGGVDSQNQQIVTPTELLNIKGDGGAASPPAAPPLMPSVSAAEVGNQPNPVPDQPRTNPFRRGAKHNRVSIPAQAWRNRAEAKPNPSPTPAIAVPVPGAAPAQPLTNPTKPNPAQRQTRQVPVHARLEEPQPHNRPFKNRPQPQPKPTVIQTLPLNVPVTSHDKPVRFPQDKQRADRLRDHARKQGNPVSRSPKCWERAFGTLRRRFPDGADEIIDRALAYVETHPAQKPAIRCGADLLNERVWNWLTDKMTEAEQTAAQTRPVSAEAQKIVDKLAGNNWPARAKLELPGAVQQSLDFYAAFRAKLKVFDDKYRNGDDRGLATLAAIAAKFLGTQHRPFEFVYYHFSGLYDKFSTLDKWAGGLNKFVVGREAVDLVGRRCAADYCCDGDKWLTLVNQLGDVP